MTTQVITNHAEELIFRAGLLAGMGAAARAAARATLAPAPFATEEAQAEGRTCIDGGDPLLFSVVAPGGRALRVAVRQQRAVGEGMRHWRRFAFSDGATGRPPLAVETVLVAGEPDAAWETLHGWLGSAAAAARLGPARAVLGGRGRLYLAARPPANEACPGWLSWHLDRRAAPAEALLALGEPHVWEQVRHWYGKLLGAPVSERARPWSVGISLGEGPPRLRVGTTHWARQPEAPDKSRRLARLVSELGGDGRYAESLYKLVAGAWPEPRAHGIGAVVEFEFEAGQLRAAEFFIRARLPVEEDFMPPDSSHIDAETLLFLQGLGPDENPVVGVFIAFAATPTAAEMATMDAAGLVLSPGGGPVYTARVPARAIPALAALPSVAMVQIGSPLRPDNAPFNDYDADVSEPPVTNGFDQ